ncbi:hypothetical protein ACFL2Q_02830 [Thermodesulfobacteriota bacterium]
MATTMNADDGKRLAEIAEANDFPPHLIAEIEKCQGFDLTAVINEAKEAALRTRSQLSHYPISQWNESIAAELEDATGMRGFPWKRVHKALVTGTLNIEQKNDVVMILLYTLYVKEFITLLVADANHIHELINDARNSMAHLRSMYPLSSVSSPS